MSPEQAETRLFAQALVCSEELAYRLQPDPDDEPGRRARIASAERLLRSLVGIETTSSEDPEGLAGDPTIHRIEAKLDLALELLARVLAREHPAAPLRPIRWSRLGASVELSDAPDPGSRMLLSLELEGGLGLPLRLPVEVLASRPGSAEHALARVWLAFPDDSPALESALERFVFRQHRRQIAASRRGHG